MKKLLSLLTLLVVAISTSWAEDFTVTPIKGSYNYTSLAKVTLGTNVKISSGQIQTNEKNQVGDFTISTTQSGLTIKSVSFTDANHGSASKLVTLETTSGDGNLSHNTTDDIWTYTDGTTNSVTFQVTANSGGAGKLGTISIVVSSATNNIETLSDFSLTSGTYSFTTKVGGEAATSTVTLTTPTSSGGSVSESNISLSSNRTITFTSERNIKYISFNDTNCRASFSVDAGGGTCDGATWSAGETETKSVTLKNAAGTTLSGLNKVYVITEAEGPKDGSFSISSSELEIGKTLKIQLAGDDEFEDFFTAGTLWESEAGGPYVSLSADGTITGVKTTPDGYYFTFTANSQNTEKYNTTTGNRIDVSVVAAKIDTELSFGTPTTTVAKGESVTNVATLTAGGEAISGTVTYSSDNEAVATVNETTGEVTGVAVGSAKITATFAGDATYSGSTADYTITVPLPAVDTKFWTSASLLSAAPSGAKSITGTTVIDDLEVVGSSTAFQITTGGDKTIDGQTVGGRARFGKNGTAEGNYLHFKVKPNTKITMWGIRATAGAETNGLALSVGAVGTSEKVYSFAAGDVESLTLYYLGSEDGDIYAYSKATAGASMMAIKVQAIENPSITLNAKGFATYSTDCDFTFSGAKAYKMSLNESAGTIAGTEVTGAIAAGEGVLFKGEAGATVTITPTTGAEALEGNSLQGSTDVYGNIVAKPTYCYALSGDTFKNFTGDALTANKAFFSASSNLSNSFEIVFEGEGEATAVEAVAEANAEASAPIKVIKNGKLYIGNFNVAGQQVK